MPINEMRLISNDIPRICASICVVHSTRAEFLGRRVAGTIVEPAPNSQLCFIMCDYSTCSKPSILLTLLLWPQTVFTPRAHARSGVKQSVLSVSQSSVSQSSVSRLSGGKN